MPFLITPKQLLAICPKLESKRVVTLANIITDTCNRYGMDSVNRAEEFIATIVEESGEFSTYTENLNYSAKRLMEVWPSRFKTLEVAKKYAFNPQALANNVYANRMGNGDEKSGDGYRFRGMGSIQITGKNLYTMYAKYRGKTIDEIMKHMTEDEGAIDSAAWYFTKVANLIDESEKNDFLTIVKVVNGGTVNLDTRIKYLNKVKTALK